MNEDPDNKGTDFSDYARKRPGAPEPQPHRQSSDTERFLRRFLLILLRVFGIAVGLAFVLYLLVVGVCLLA